VRTQALQSVQVWWSISMLRGVKANESWGQTPTQAPHSKQSATLNKSRFPAALRFITTWALASSTGIVGRKFKPASQ
jgi:hypothetical protein